MRAWLCVAALLAAVPGLGRTVVQGIALRDPLHPDRPPATYPVRIALDAQGFPSGYSLDLFAETCFDGTCKPIEVVLHWDALGRYARLECPPGRPLTKKEHDPFDPRDHARLDAILADAGSLLGRQPLAFFAGAPPEDPDGVDGITAATPLAVQEAVVPGAAYTSWILWHWVNGEAPAKLRALAEQRCTPETLKAMLRSNDPGQVRFALDFLLARHPVDGQYAAECLHILETGGRQECMAALRYLEAAVDGDALDLRLAGLFGRNAGSSRLLYRRFESRLGASPTLRGRLAGRLDDLPEYERHQAMELLGGEGTEGMP